MIKQIFMTGVSLVTLMMLSGCSYDPMQTISHEIAQRSPVNVEVVITEDSIRALDENATIYYVDLYFNRRDVSESEFAERAEELLYVVMDALEEMEDMDHHWINLRLVEDHEERAILSWSTTSLDSSSTYSFGRLGGTFDFHLDINRFYNIRLSDAGELIDRALDVQVAHQLMVENFAIENFANGIGANHFVETQQVVRFINETEWIPSSSVSGGEVELTLITGVEFLGVGVYAQTPTHRSVRYFVDDAQDIYNIAYDTFQAHEIELQNLMVTPASTSIRTLSWHFSDEFVSDENNRINVVVHGEYQPYPFDDVQAVINETFSTELQAEDFLLEHLTDVDEVRVVQTLGSQSPLSYSVTVLTSTPVIEEFGTYVREITDEIRNLFLFEMEINLGFLRVSELAQVSVTLADYVEWTPTRFRAFNTGLDVTPDAISASRSFLGHVDDVLILEISLNEISSYIQRLLNAGAWQ